jgi:hypothetical protein
MGLIMSLSMVTRIVLGALAIGFLIGTIVGYQAGETGTTDVRAVSGSPTASWADHAPMAWSDCPV